MERDLDIDIAGTKLKQIEMHLNQVQDDSYTENEKSIVLFFYNSTLIYSVEQTKA